MGAPQWPKLTVANAQFLDVLSHNKASEFQKSSFYENASFLIPLYYMHFSLTEETNFLLNNLNKPHTIGAHLTHL